MVCANLTAFCKPLRAVAPARCCPSSAAPPSTPSFSTTNDHDRALATAAKEHQRFAQQACHNIRTRDDLTTALVADECGILMNNFATNARIIESRGMNWEDRAVEIAVLTVLETEFPAVVPDLIQRNR